MCLLLYLLYKNSRWNCHEIKSNYHRRKSVKTILCLNRPHDWKPLFKLALFSSALDNCYMLSFPSLVGVAFFPATLCCSMLEVLHGPQTFILLFINFAALGSGSASSWTWHSPQFNTSLTFIASLHAHGHRGDMISLAWWLLQKLQTNLLYFCYP